MAFTSITSVIEGVLSYRRIFIPQIGLDYFQNFAFIIAIFLASITSERILIAGLGVGYIVRMFVLLWAANRNGFRFTRESTSIRTTYLQLAPLAFPVFLGNLSQQFSVFVNRRLASSLPTGSVSALYFANQANLIIITIGIAILTTVIYPHLLKSAAEKKWIEFGSLCQRGLDMTIVIVVPCALGSLIFRREIISILYERGAFDSQAAELTSVAFFCYSMGLVFLGANDFITKVFFAQGKMRTVMYASLVGVCANVALNIMLTRFIGFAGLALASSIAAIVTFLFMFAKLIDCFKEWGISFSFRIARQATLSAMISVFGGYIVCFLIRREWNWSDNASFFAAVMTSGVLYVICLKVSGITRVLQDGAQ
jgi:putative peptidoglycan lipid II flippase